MSLGVLVSRACKTIEREASGACERRVHDELRLGDQLVAGLKVIVNRLHAHVRLIGDVGEVDFTA